MSNLILPPQSIDYGSPVNWLCPLTRGLVSWWLCVPGTMGGSRFIDLCGRNHGTLTNMDPASDWVPQSHVGGFGSILFERASNQNVTLPSTTTSLDLGNTGTVACWINAKSLPGTSSFVEKQNVSAGRNGYSLYWYANNIYISIASATAENFRTFSFTSLNQWVHVIGTWDGTTLSLYKNGVLQSSTSQTLTPTPSSRTFYFGGGYGAFDGKMDGVQISGRALSASEVMSLYQDSRLGHPQMLSRIRRPMTFEGAAAVGARKSSHLTLMGVG